MLIRSSNSKMTLLAALTAVQTGCVSHQHQPDPASLVTSEDCEIINGSYRVGSVDDGRLLAKYLFDDDDIIVSLTIEKGDYELAFGGTANDGRELPKVFFVRTSCANSILRFVLNDGYSAGGMVMEASDRVADIFGTDESTIDIRFINTTMAFFFVIPYYGSSDQLVRLQRQP